MRDDQWRVLAFDVAQMSHLHLRFQSMLDEMSQASYLSSSQIDIGAPARGSLWTTGQAASAGEALLPRLPSSSDRRSVSSSSERWEGVVLGIERDVFRARLVDLDRQTPDEEAEIYLSEVSDEDRVLVEPGAIFYWSIGYYTDRTGQRMRRSLVRFRRLPTWTKSELDEARREAEKTSKLLGWGSEPTDATAKQ